MDVELILSGIRSLGYHVSIHRMGGGISLSGKLFLGFDLGELE